MNGIDNNERHPGAVIGAWLLLLAAIILWDASNLRVNPVFGLGPKAMPIVVASGLVALAFAHLSKSMRRELPVTLILTGLALLILLIGQGGGFIPAIAILFAMTAAAFGRRAFIADLLIGAVLALIAYLLFSKLLSLSLPSGFPESQIDRLWGYLFSS